VKFQTVTGTIRELRLVGTENGVVALVATDVHGHDWYLLSFYCNGTVERAASVSGELGLRLTKTGDYLKLNKET